LGNALIYIIYIFCLKNEIWPFATTRMNMEDFMLNAYLSDISQTQKNTACSHLSGKGEFIETESRMVVTRGREV
jgi:hypothetical protein